MSILDKPLANWVFRPWHSKLAVVGEDRPSVTGLEAEFSRLKRELAEARMERDISTTRQEDESRFSDIDLNR